ncbi:zinc-dependent alcohol dehydrogenase family protein [Parasphingopyxis marina]|uniref:NAD(P)-dependent alcohol dehydrogenase n=1 Tax=Parasphingopyxis marina TaxID=2761622 RepID=A0A842I3M3_9SPHN|nr:NAD(P)-dependent alcohol dehydrogenase [Parasphingopyxis marina]MBC2778634.1 NAD(P)-dependent alcohol dehydrogenase [Parasphingopyxis marina]
MKAWQLTEGASSLDDLHLVELDKPEPGPGEVLIKVHACSLNYRDQAVMTGNYFGGRTTMPLIPLSDGAGEVEAVGSGVTQFAPGDRVAGTFFQNWDDGPPNPSAGPALGAPPANGMLAEYVALPEQGVVAIAESLSFEEAATLPCAGVTAWHALMEGPKAAGPDSTVLVLGTGGVSLLALQIARARGATVIATSSSDEKLERVKALGAAQGINYRATPEWGAEAAKLSGKGGADHVVEVGGAGTLAQSIAAVGFNGEIALIGVLTREGDTSPHGLMLKGASIRGIFVGSRGMARRLNALIDDSGFKPVVDKVFPFEEAKAAFEYQSSPELFGKVVIAVGS